MHLSPRVLLKALLCAGSLSLLAACQPGSVPTALNNPGASGSPQPSVSASPSPTGSPVPGLTPGPGPTGSARPNPPASLPGGVSRIRISAERSSFSAAGQQARLRAVLLNATGQEVNSNLRIEWASSRSGIISIDDTGLAKALAVGSSEITARITGSDLIARLELSVGSSSGSSSGSRGGVGSSPNSSPTAEPTTEPTATPSTEPTAEPTSAPTAEPSLVPASNEYRANTYTLGGQTHPAMASDANGNFVMVWQSYGQDGSGEGIYGQRFNWEGAALGDEFQINQGSTGDQKLPDVAMAADGSFVVSWQSAQSGDPDVYGRVYAGDGAAASDELRINTVTGGDQTEPKVAAYGNDYLFTWTSEGSDGSQTGVYARAYDYPGTASSGELRVNETTTGAQFAPDVAMGAAGAVIAWTSHGQSGGYSFDVYARRYDLAGNASGSEFRVNETTGSQEWIPSVAIHDTGSFVLAWNSKGQDGDGDGVYARAYASTGAAASGELAVNQTSAGHQSQAAVAIFSAENFIITWTSQGQDGDDAGVYARAFNDYGAASGFNEYQVHSTRAGAQNYPAITLGSGSLFGAIGWASANLDGDDFGIYFSLLED